MCQILLQSPTFYTVPWGLEEEKVFWAVWLIELILSTSYVLWLSIDCYLSFKIGVNYLFVIADLFLYLLFEYWHLDYFLTF